MIEELVITILVLLNQINIVPQGQDNVGFFSKFIKDEPLARNFDYRTKNIVYRGNNIKIESILQSLPVRNSNIPELNVDAKSVIVLDAGTDAILYSKDANKKLPIASLTKIMTALVVLDKADLGMVAIVSKNALDIEKRKNSLEEGEKISIENLLKVMLIESNNVAAFSLAENTGESVEGFVKLMNEKAKLLGLKNTNFSNPAGLDQQENYSTAYDVAQLVDYALNKKVIWDILKTPKTTVTSLDGKIEHKPKNTNLLLGKISNIVGGKTGFTDEAGECLVLVVEDSQKKRRIITVVLGAKDRFAETEKIVKWTFESYKW